MTKHNNLMLSGSLMVIMMGLLFIAGCATQTLEVNLPPSLGNKPIDQNIEDQSSQPRNQETHQSSKRNWKSPALKGVKEHPNIVMILNITGKRPADQPGVDIIKDAIRDKILAMNDYQFQIIDSDRIDSDFELSGEVKMDSFMTNTGRFVVELTMSNLRLTNMYDDDANKIHEKAAILSAPTIQTSQEADTENQALDMVSLQAMIKLERKGFFHRLASDRIISQWKGGGWLIEVENTPSQVKEMIDDFKQQLFSMKLNLYGISIDMKEEFKEAKQSIARELDNKFKNLPRKEIIKEQKIIYKYTKQQLEEDVYKDASGVKIEIKHGQLTPTPLTSIIEDSGYADTSLKLKLHLFKRNDPEKINQEKLLGKKTAKLKGSAKNGHIILSEEEYTKLHKLEEHHPGILSHPGILVIY